MIKDLLMSLLINQTVLFLVSQSRLISEGGGSKAAGMRCIDERIEAFGLRGKLVR